MSILPLGKLFYEQPVVRRTLQRLEVSQSDSQEVSGGQQPLVIQNSKINKGLRLVFFVRQKSGGTALLGGWGTLVYSS